MRVRIYRRTGVLTGWTQFCRCEPISVHGYEVKPSVMVQGVRFQALSRHHCTTQNPMPNYENTAYVHYHAFLIRKL